MESRQLGRIHDPALEPGTKTPAIMSNLHSVLDVGVSGQGVVSRRDFLRQSLGLCRLLRRVLFWLARFARRQGRRAAPSRQIDDLAVDGRRPQPVRHIQSQTRLGQSRAGAGDQHGRAWRASGRVLAATAQVMDKIALMRSMVSSEKEHDRAIALVRTGYQASPAIRYPAWGSIVAMQRERADAELPSFVRIGRPRITTRDVDAGVLGVSYNPFKIDEAGKLPPESFAQRVARGGAPPVGPGR